MRRPAPHPAPGSALRFLLLALACGVGGAAAAQTGVIAGAVTDAATGEPLPAASALVLGTSVGAATDLGGRFEIPNAPAGPQRLRVSFAGYEPDTLDVVVPDGGRVEVTAELEAQQLGEVVVSAQLEGQREAIAQQLESNQIVNVVSGDRIREVPDQNAVESIGRLPGISVQRNAGEGQKVVVRGLSPRFNNVTVNGQRVPATDGADRSVDLSLISQDALEGIEVYKSLTPDQDGDAIGGAVNLVTARASEGLRATLDATGGYNGLNGDFGDYRVGGAVSQRFAGGRLGLVVSGTAQRADRGSRQLDADYQADGTEERPDGTEAPIVIITSAVLADRVETRERYNANVALDVDLGEGHAVVANGLYARTDRSELRYRRLYQPSISNVYDEVRDRDLSLDLASLSLRGEHTLFDRVELTWQGAAAQSLNRSPLSVAFRFSEPAGLRGDFDDRGSPRDLPRAAVNDSTRMRLDRVFGESSRVLEGNLTGQLDLRVRYGQAGSGVYGFVKTGAKVRDVHRSREDLERTNGFTTLSDRVRALYPERFRTTGGNFIVTADNFFSGEAGPADFFGGDFPAPNRYDVGLLTEVYGALASAQNGLVSPLSPQIDSYVADETVTAGYVMAEVNLGPRVMVLPGVRYEYADNSYQGSIGDRIGGNFGEAGTVRDTTGGQSYGEWLPMVQARFRPSDWLDLRAAVTRTLNRPDYADLVPFRAVNFQAATFRQGDPDLRHATAWNYDLSASLYSARYGLFTVGGFYKAIDDLVYTQVSQDLTPGSPFFGLVETRPVNAGQSTSVYGLEVDVQTNLGFVPGPLSGVVFNANYARVWSETAFPTIEREPGGPPFFTPVITIGERLGPAPQQSDHIANASLGYERYGFSGRVSLTYQSAYLDVPSVLDPVLDASIDDFVRWDLSLTQRLGGGLTALANVNNLTSLADRSFVGAGRLANEELFGWTANVGLRFRFDS